VVAGVASPGNEVHVARASITNSDFGIQLRSYLDSNIYLRRKNLRRLSPYIQGEVLEVGVGQGPDIGFFKQMPSLKTYTGCDREDRSQLFMDGRAHKRGIVLYRGDRLPFGDEQFDTVINIDCMEHMPYSEIAPFIREIRRVLRVGGHAVVLAPFVYPEHCAPQDYFRFTHFGLQQLAKANCLSTTCVTSQSSNFETYLVMALHSLFFHCFPGFLVKHYGTSNRVDSRSNLLKLLMLPFTSVAYLSLFLGFHLLSRVTTYRDSADFSIGYSIVLKKEEAECIESALSP
jgi:SAM-dependent methyltransferase